MGVWYGLESVYQRQYGQLILNKYTILVLTYRILDLRPADGLKMRLREWIHLFFGDDGKFSLIESIWQRRKDRINILLLSRSTGQKVLRDYVQ